MAKKKGPPPPWGYVFYEQGGRWPAWDWLQGLPAGVRTEFGRTIDAVLFGYQPPPTVYLMNRWHPMKKVGNIDMGGYHEGRDQLETTNYRLYCRFDRDAVNDEALGSPVLVILHGASKPDGQAMPESVYLEVQRRWATYFQPERRCSDIEFPPVDLEPSP